MIRRDLTGASGRQVGNEIDVTIYFHLTNQSDILVSYSKLYAGPFLDNTGTGNAEAFYLMYSFRW